MDYGVWIMGYSLRLIVYRRMGMDTVLQIHLIINP
jgi:hypothetical protein